MPVIRSRCVRLLALACLLALVGAACTSTDDLEALKEQIEREGSDASAEGVDAPPPADPSLTGRPGLFVWTNSRTWRALLGAPNVEGATILYVQPGGPSDGTGLSRGDVLTAVDGEPVRNSERAVVLLRSKPGQTQRLEVVKRGGERTTVDVTGRKPEGVSLLRLLSQRLESNPDDRIARFVRAQEWPLGQFENALADLQTVIEAEPDFTEAIATRGWFSWLKGNRDPSVSAQRQGELRAGAMTDLDVALRLDPRNVQTLAWRGQVLAEQGNVASAKSDGEKAVSSDETMPRGYYVIGLARLGLGQHAAAAAPARRAIELNPYDVGYYEVLATAFMKLGRRADAKATVDAIVDLVDHTPTREKLLRIPEG